MSNTIYHLKLMGWGKASSARDL